MFPIHEQSNGKGIGYGRDEFLTHIDHIFSEQKLLNTTVFFAFIFYNREDGAIRKTLKDNLVFTKLDRLSGERLHIFYLHAPPEETLQFNKNVMTCLGFEESVTLPGILFFKWANGNASDLEYVELRSKRTAHAFQELHSIISEALVTVPTEKSESLVKRTYRAIRSGASFIAQETVKAALRAGLNHLPF